MAVLRQIFTKQKQIIDLRKHIIRIIDATDDRKLKKNRENNNELTYFIGNQYA